MEDLSPRANAWHRVVDRITQESWDLVEASRRLLASTAHMVDTGPRLSARAAPEPGGPAADEPDPSSEVQA